MTAPNMSDVSSNPMPAKKKTATKKVAKKATTKKPLTGYMLFASERRADVVAENPGIKFGEIGKLLGAQWSKLTEAEKAKYDKPATEEEDKMPATKAPPTKAPPTKIMAAPPAKKADVMERIAKIEQQLHDLKRALLEDSDDDSI